MPKPVDPIDQIAKSIACHRRNKRWCDHLTGEHAATVARIREAWLAGRLGTKRRTAAREISAYLKSAGIADVGVQGIDQWLQRP